MLIPLLLDLVQQEFKHPAPVWVTVTPQDVKEDIQFLHRECNKESEFDPHNARKNMLQYLDKGQFEIRQCAYGQVIAIYEKKGQKEEMPWEVWGRILALFGKTGKESGKLSGTRKSRVSLSPGSLKNCPSRISHKSPHISGNSSRIMGKSPHISGNSSRIMGRISRIVGNPSRIMRNSSPIFGHFFSKSAKIFLLAHSAKRLFPQGPITPQNINGGYTYPCNKEMIMIYRAEDATRVLIHELMHAYCLDHMDLGIDQVEAETEAWAELIYIAILSKGDPQKFKRYHQQQSDWMQRQNQRVKTYIKDTRAFPWRYTVGKEEVWRRWGILLPLEGTQRIDSLRLTYPIVKSYYGIL